MESKRGCKLQAHRRITKSYKILRQDFQKLYDFSILYESFINQKPFYLSRSTKKRLKCVCVVIV